jgi:hypothetical protein
MQDSKNNIEYIVFCQLVTWSAGLGKRVEARSQNSGDRNQTMYTKKKYAICNTKHKGVWTK